MKIRVLFTLFPIGYWIVVLVGALIDSNDPEYKSLGYFLINLGFFLLLFKSAMIIHEVGHLFAAKVVGGRPRRIRLGKGNELSRFTVFGIKIIVHSRFNGGAAMASFDKTSLLKLRYAVYLIGGLGANVLIASLVYLVF